MNINIPTCSQILYDANVIVYYVISVKVTIEGDEKNFRIPDFTDKSQKLTKELIEHDKIITTPNSILDEIYKKGLAKIVHGYCSSAEIKQLLGVDEVDEDIELHVFSKAEQKLKKLLVKEWFEIIDYNPTEKNIDTIRTFYNSLEKTPKMQDHMKRKFTHDPAPAYKDMALLCCSLDTSNTLVSNDTDITRFIPELEQAGLCYDIINLAKVTF